MSSAMIKNDKATINAWCMYDWANSVFSLTITTAIFPDYFLGITPSNINFFGRYFPNGVVYEYTVSIAFLIAALLSPFLTSIADYSGRKKAFMRMFCYIGSFSCILLYWFAAPDGQKLVSQTMAHLGVIGFMLGLIGYSGSIVFYNSFLPEIATEDQYDRVSARGFSLGYIGSVILLIANIVCLLMHEKLHITQLEAARISFLTVGIWWFVFAHFTFAKLKEVERVRSASGHWLLNGLSELKKVWKQIGKLKLLKTYLVAFFFFSMGVQTVMYLAPIFAKEEIGLEQTALIATILIIQLVAIPGAMMFNFLSSVYGNTKALIMGVSVWILICIIGYYVQKGWSFYTLAVMIGYVMGGIQSLARATYAKLIPEDTEDHASYFSFYDVAEKMSIVLGTFLYGLCHLLTGSARNSVILLGVLFIIGLIFLLRIPSKKVYMTHVEE